MATGATVIGRESELGQIAQYLDVVRGRPSALVLAGEAGIGKTTLWEWAVNDALRRGWHVLKTRPSSSETTMTFAALGDLLGPVIDEAVGELPAVQSSALDAALLRGESHASMPDQRAVSLASLGCLRALAQAGPVLLAIDDVQWLDMPSANVLRFVLRRLSDEPVGVLASLRLGEVDGDRLDLDQTLPGARARRLVVGSMSTEELGRLIRQRLATELPHPVIKRVHDAAGGNPFFALEIVDQLIREGVPEVGEVLPIPDDVRDLLKARLSVLPEPTQELLLVAAATSRPTESLVAAAAELGPGTDAALVRAIDAGVVSLETDRIRFTHPLLASTVYASAPPSRRREIHRRLAANVNDVEERARHLALASSGPDADVASALDDAAAIAGERGAPQSAAELANLAYRLTPVSDAEGSIRRAEQAAGHLFEAGDDARARFLLEDALAGASTGHDRARLLYRLASVSWMDMHRVSELCGRALDQAGDDPGLAAAIHDHLAWVGIYRGDLTGATRHAQASMDHLTLDTDPAIRADVLATFSMVESLGGRPAEASMAEAERLHEVATSRVGHPGDRLHRCAYLPRAPAPVGERAESRETGPRGAARRVRSPRSVHRPGRDLGVLGRTRVPSGQLGSSRAVREGGIRDRRRVGTFLRQGPSAVPQGARRGAPGARRRRNF